MIESAVVTGRATLRIMGISLPARFRFTHEAGKSYRHFIEATWFGLPVMTVNEQYIDGRSRLELPFGVTERYVARFDSATALLSILESIVATERSSLPRPASASTAESIIG